MRYKARTALPVAVLVLGLVPGLAMGNHNPINAGPAPRIRVLSGETPQAVASGTAAVRRHHDPRAMLTLTIGLGVHDSVTLDGIIAAATDPAGPFYGHYLTRSEYRARFAPTDAEARAVQEWARGAGLDVLGVSPDNLLVIVRGTAGSVERALGVRLDEYSLPDRAFMSNDRDPAVPANLDIAAISGLTTIHRFHSTLNRAGAGRSWRLRATTRLGNVRPGGYYPADFRAAYVMDPVGDGNGQTIGLTLWGAPVAQSDLHTFAVNTGTTEIVSGTAGANGIDWLRVNGGSSDTGALDETAMDVEYAHGAAPNSHLKYWLSDCAYDPSLGYCNPSDTGLEQAIDAAARDTSLHVVSNSWGGDEAISTTMAGDPFTAITTNLFQYAASVGTTFYFASGDQGYYSGNTQGPDGTRGCNPTADASCVGLASYPADSPYVVSVGGTTLNTGTGYAYGSETTWNGSGGGCSGLFARPSWQTGAAAATCAGRAEPDVSADADPGTGAYVYVRGGGEQVGGTSLATPLWAGMAADLDRYLSDHGRPLMGFAAPGIYQLATNATTYNRDFHDVTTGRNDPDVIGRGYAAGSGWDEATGWGSPNLTALAADWAANITAPTGTPAPPTATLLPTITPVPTGASAPTPTPAPTGASTPTPTPAPTGASTPTPASTGTTTGIPAPTSTCTPTSATTPAPTNTATATDASVATPSSTTIAVVSSTSTALALSTATCTVTSTSIPAPSSTSLAAPATATPDGSATVPAATRTPLTASTATDTPTSTAATATDTPTSTASTAPSNRATTTPTSGASTILPTGTSTVAPPASSPSETGTAIPPTPTPPANTPLPTMAPPAPTMPPVPPTAPPAPTGTTAPPAATPAPTSTVAPPITAPLPTGTAAPPTVTPLPPASKAITATAVPLSPTSRPAIATTTRPRVTATRTPAAKRTPTSTSPIDVLLAHRLPIHDGATLAAGSSITVRVHAGTHTSIGLTVTLTYPTGKVIVTGKRRIPVQKTMALYAHTVTSDTKGQVARDVRIATVATSRSIHATLTVQIRACCRRKARAITRAIHVLLISPHRQTPPRQAPHRTVHT